MFRFVAPVALRVVLVSGCLQPLRRYALSAPATQVSREEQLQELGRVTHTTPTVIP